MPLLQPTTEAREHAIASFTATVTQLAELEARLARARSDERPPLIQLLRVQLARVERARTACERIRSGPRAHAFVGRVEVDVAGPGVAPRRCVSRTEGVLHAWDDGRATFDPLDIDLGSLRARAEAVDGELDPRSGHLTVATCVTIDLGGARARGRTKLTTRTNERGESGRPLEGDTARLAGVCELALATLVYDVTVRVDLSIGAAVTNDGGPSFRDPRPALSRASRSRGS